MTHNTAPVIVACVAVAAVLIAACGGGDGNGLGTTTPAPSDVEKTPDSGVCLLGETRLPLLAACEALAEQLQVSRSEVEVVSVTAMDWPNSCLGAPRPGEACAEVITPGFKVVLRVRSAASLYTYHTDQASSVRLAEVDLSASPFGELQLVVRGSEPVAFAFTPDGQLLYNERRLGEIRSVAAGALDGSSELFASVPTFRGSECGLLGIAVDPEFATNHYVYVYVTQPVEGRTDVGKPRIVRLTEVDGRGTAPFVLLDDFPLTNETDCAHVSGNVHFGPDGYLYVSVGNFERPATSADLSQLTGKVLRINKTDGSAAPGNPFASTPGADARVYALGLRNTFDFAFDQDTGAIYGAENGPGNCDELNVLVAGGDYGVPGSLDTVGDIESCLGLGGVDPIYLFAGEGSQPHEFGSNVAPAGMAFLGGGLYPGLGEGLLICEYVPHELHFLRLAEDQRSVTEDLLVNSECRFNVEVYQDTIYYSNGQGIYKISAPTP